MRPKGKEAAVVTYPDAPQLDGSGIKNVKDSPKRLDGVTLGEYDLVLVVDMPNNDKVATLGNVRSTTLRAYSEDDYRRIISGLS